MRRDKIQKDEKDPTPEEECEAQAGQGQGHRVYVRDLSSAWPFSFTNKHGSQGENPTLHTGVLKGQAFVKNCSNL